MRLRFAVGRGSFRRAIGQRTLETRHPLESLWLFSYLARVTETETFFASVRDPGRFREAVRLFDEANAADPNIEQADGQAWPRELLYAHRLADWVMRLCPTASEELRLASRCQHLCRWMIPRHRYEQTRAGYLKWRTELKAFHAQKSGEILRQVGYDEEVVHRVQALNLKREFPRDPETCVLEDALCLVFLEFQSADLAQHLSQEKLNNALQKIWKKMSPAGQAAARALSLPEP